MFPTLFCSLLYHTKQQLGTTTYQYLIFLRLLLYHTKQQLGTTTDFLHSEYLFNYIIPNNNWELQHTVTKTSHSDNYIIPNNNWELQPYRISIPAYTIISYQTTTGNYNVLLIRSTPLRIISYQTTTGNYNLSLDTSVC